MRVKTNFVKLVVVLGVLLVAGCLVPEKFTADSTINKDKSYAFVFKGTMVYLPYRMDERKAKEESRKRVAAMKAQMTDKELATMEAQMAHIELVERDAEMAEIAKELLEQEGDAFKKVQYVGNGVFDMEYATAGELTETYFFSNHRAKIICFSPENDGTIVVQSEGEDDWDELKKHGIVVDGKFSLITDAEVLEHNAQKTPGMFAKAYVWKIGSGNPPPYMVLKSSEYKD